MFKGILIAIVSLLTAIASVFTPPSAEPTMPLVNVNPNPIKQEALAQDLTVMSYNLKCSGEGRYSQESRKDAVCTLIDKYSPDSLGVQEADKNWVGLLNATLTDYANVGTYRDDGISEGESNNIFYKKDKYELVDSGDFWLSKTPDVPSKDWDSACYRICTYAVLKDKQTGFVYAHFNTHFDHVSDVAQAESVALISSKIAEIAPDIPVVLTGDFNFNETVEFVKEARFLDAHIFPYSEREGTEAAAMKNKVPVTVRRERAAKLIEIQNSVRNSLLDEIVDKEPTVSVLFETCSDGFVHGHTDSFLAVTAKSECDLHGEIRKVKLTSHKDGICFGVIQ